jgi:hypothetical protein
MSLAIFASVLFKARVSIINVFAKPIACSIRTSLDIFCLHAQFFQTSYLFSLNIVGMLIVTSDPPDTGDSYDTSPPVEHPNNTFTVFLFYV